MELERTLRAALGLWCTHRDGAVDFRCAAVREAAEDMVPAPTHPRSPKPPLQGIWRAAPTTISIPAPWGGKDAPPSCPPPP